MPRSTLASPRPHVALMLICVFSWLVYAAYAPAHASSAATTTTTAPTASDRAHESDIAPDAGATWSGPRPRVGTVSALVSAPGSPSVLYASVGVSGEDYNTGRSGLYKSTDGGLNWTRTNLNGNFAITLAVDPYDASTVYAGTGLGLFKSIDGGASWAGPYMNPSYQALSLAIDPSATNVLYAGTAGAGIYKSTDGGLTWTSSNNGINFYSILSVVVNPSSANTIYAAGGPGSYAGVFKSTDGGANWTRYGNGLPAADVLELAFDSSNTAVMYAGTASGVYRSVNGGANWTASSAGLPPGAQVASLAVNPANTSTLFAATAGSDGVYKSTDAGATWTPAKTGNTVNVVLIDPTGMNVYAGSRGLGVFKSTDGGTLWQQSNEGFPFPVVTHCVVDPGNPSVIYIGTTGGLYKSTDRGATWDVARLVEYSRPLNGLVIDSKNPSTLFAALDFIGVLKSMDGGLTWSHVFGANTNFGMLAISPTNPQHLFVRQGTSSLLKSTDGGAHWGQMPSPGLPQAVVFDPRTESLVYAIANNLVRRSSNGGMNWTTLALVTAQGTTLKALTADSVNQNTLYVFSSGAKSIRKTTDGGTTWNEAGSGLPATASGVYDIRAIVIDPLNASTLYAAVYGTAEAGGGIYRSIDGGGSWSLFQSPLGFVNTLSFDLSGRNLYAGTNQGLYQTETATSQATGFSTDLYQVDEGAGAGVITVNRADASGTLNVSYATSGGAATDGQDYTAATGTLTFAEGETSKIFNVSILEDSLDEFDEHVLLTLTSTGATPTVLGKASLLVTDNDLSPTLTVGDVSALEGDSDITNFVFNVSLSSPTAKTVTVDVGDADGTASSAFDFYHYGGPYTLTFAPGETLKTVNMLVRGDLEVEPDETFFVNARNLVNAAAGDLQGQGTILNDDITPTVSLSINDVSVVEGNTGTTDAVFTVSLSGAAPKTVSVGYYSSPGVSGDFQAISGILRFAPGETTKTITMSIFGDTRFEPDERFEMRLNDPINALMADDLGVFTIINDDAPPTVSINDVVITEGDNGTKEAIFTVTMSSEVERQVFFRYAAAPGTATENVDYFWVSGGALFGPGVTTRTISVPVGGDTVAEPDETFFVRLSDVDGATLADGEGMCTIIDNDGAGGAPTFQFSTTQYTVPEAGNEATVTVTRSGDLSTPATVDYSTERINNTRSASDRSDYTIAVGTLRFAAGESFRAFKVLITDDAFAERDPNFGDEFINLVLSNPTGGVALGTPHTSSIMITENDTVTASRNPVDDAAFFVRQHYHDFFSRDADASGLQFWTNQITSCGADEKCIEARRINVSAAFFLSTEFQRTGYQVIRFYKASFTDSSARPRGLPRAREFFRDTQEIGRGVVVGESHWEQQLADNTLNFARRWVESAEFVGAFPASMTAEQFVDKLFADSEATPTQGERAAAVSAYGAGGVEGRAAALLNVTNSGSVYNRQYNPAFVLMQYYGYLRRNPDEAPDANFAGYDFWLAKLNEFSQPGEDVRDERVALSRVQRAEMVKSFITSGEYRQRFGL